MYETTYPTTTTAASGGIIAAFFGIYMLVVLAVALLVIIGLWKTFSKAGKPGWAAIIPIYNIIVMLEIAGRPIWWILLYLVPLVNLVVYVVISVDIAKKFGKSAAFGIIALWLFAPIGFLLLGFGKATYQAGSASVTPAESAPPAEPTPPAA
jgi:uncharacterized membrane protein YoaK (UPF0700 family)